MMDTFIEETPFFTNEQRSLAGRVAGFIAREVEPLAGEEQEIERHFRVLRSPRRVRRWTCARSA